MTASERIRRARHLASRAVSPIGLVVREHRGGAVTIVCGVGALPLDADQARWLAERLDHLRNDETGGS